MRTTLNKGLLTAGARLIRASQRNASGKNGEGPSNTTIQNSKQVERLQAAAWVPHPMDFAALQRMYDQNPWNAAAVEAIVDAVVGYRVEIVPSESVKATQRQPDAGQKVILTNWIKRAGGRFPLEDVLKSAQRDFENTGNLFLEVVRGEDGKPTGLFYMPAQTVQRHKDGTRYQQTRGGKRAEFWAFRAENRPQDMGEVIHLYNPNSRSTYYGIPSYLSALGSILGDSKARDYNIDRFDSKLIAPWAIVFAGELSEKVKQGIINKFRANNQNRTSAQEPLIIEAMGATDTDAVRFHRLSDEVKEASFMAFRRLNRDEILAARRVPPSKVTAFDASRFQTLPEQAEAFREEVVIPRQQKLEFALELVIAEVGITDWAIQLPVADTTEQSHLFDIAVRAVGAQSFRRNEIRSICGFPPLTKEEGGDDVVGAPPAGGENPLAALLGGQPADKSAGYHQLMQIEENIAKCLTRNDSEF